MNPIVLLTNGINELWYWTYGLVAGWGLTFTLVISALIFLFARHIKTARRVNNLENRLISLEREFNMVTKSWPGKK